MHPLVASVDDVDGVVGDRDVAGSEEATTRLVDSRRVVLEVDRLAADRLHDRPVGVEGDDAMSPGVGHPGPSIGADGDAGRSESIGGAGERHAAIVAAATPDAEEAAISVEPLHAGVATVDDRDRCRPDQRRRRSGP